MHRRVRSELDEKLRDVVTKLQHISADQRESQREIQMNETLAVLQAYYRWCARSSRAALSFVLMIETAQASTAESARSLLPNASPSIVVVDSEELQLPLSFPARSITFRSKRCAAWLALVRRWSFLPRTQPGNGKMGVRQRKLDAAASSGQGVRRRGRL